MEQTTSSNISTFTPSVANNGGRDRRTFAIISHPDAGKTTLTEKLLLYGNAIDLAGNVRARRSQRSYHLRLDGDGASSAVFRSLRPYCSSPTGIM
jgi:hypothetical protein